MMTSCVREEKRTSSRLSGQGELREQLEAERSARLVLERALRESEGRYRHLVDVCPDAILIHRDERFLSVNPAGLKMFGAAGSSDLVGRSVHDVVHPNYRPMVRGRIRSVTVHHHRADIVYQQLLRLDGSVFDAEAISTLVEYEGRPAVQTILRDVSDEHDARRELEKAQAMLLAALEHAPVGIVIVDAPDGRIRLVNSAWRSMCLGLTDQREGVCAGAPFPDWVLEDEAGHMLTGDQLPIMRALKEGSTTRNLPFTLKQQDGRQRWVMVTAAPIRDATGAIVAAVAIIPDLSDYKKAEQEREQLETQLMHSQKMEALGNMAGSVAHDFNNLMTVILGQTELLLIPNPGENRPPLREDVTNVLELIQEVCQKATSMTGDLLQFSRKRVVAREIIDVDETLGTLKPMLDRMVGREIAIRDSLSAAGTKLKANAGQVEQVIMNLVINARDALPAKEGWIEIETRVVELGEEHVRQHVGSRAGRHILMAIRDNGHGMDEQTQRHIFEPFFTTKPSGVGTGLGLSTVYGIVSDAGGHITLDSRPGEGTKFSIYWPVFTAESPDPSS